MTAAVRSGEKPGADPRRMLADELRRIAVATVAAEVPADVLQDAASAVKAVADSLEVAAGPQARARPRPDLSGPVQELFVTSPVFGPENPVAPPVRLWRDGLEVAGEAWFDHTYEGPPACVHGGVIAMVFDDVLGVANVLAGHGGMTGTLRVRYRRPTPLRQMLRLSARCLGAEGRRIRAEAAIYHGDVLTAEASGLFVAVAPERFAAMVDRHGSSPMGGLWGAGAWSRSGVDLPASGER
ncbi:MAG: PaaI family thioesterase [Actinomycetota bacterium]|nr:PaaI family thioesterase [Actinomycetota bacterium]